MNYNLLRATIPLLLLCTVSAAAPRKLYIEAREKGHRNVTLEVTKALLKECTGTIAVTEDKGSAEFSLAPASRNTVLYKANGEVEHIFTARWTVSGLAHEVCAYLDGK